MFLSLPLKLVNMKAAIHHPHNNSNPFKVFIFIGVFMVLFFLLFKVIL